MTEVRTQCCVEYRKNITVDDPNAYVETVLRFEGLTDERTEELHKIFNEFYKRVEAVVYEETTDPEMDHPRTVLTYKNGRPYFAEE